jgi:hypothetical protein
MIQERRVWMFNSTTLEVAIGMALIYLLLSLFCSAIRETIAGVLGSRAKNLERGIVSLFTSGSLPARDSEGLLRKDDSGKPIPGTALATAIYNHGLVQSLYRSSEAQSLKQWWGGGTKLPSYIPSRTFAAALFDILFSNPGTAGSTDASVPPASSSSAEHLQRMLSMLHDLPASKAREAILALVTQAEGDVVKTRRAFEAWYDDGMDRAAGWYKRKTQWVLFTLGLLIAIGLNVDSIVVGRSLWTSPALRSYAITAAEQYAKAKDGKPPSLTASQDLATLQSLALPIGWNGQKYTWRTNNTGMTDRGAININWAFAIGGWLLTAIAMTVGAPFWFDLLNQFMVIRSTIKPREKSETESSKDPK